jgi:hypothetical protein
VGPWVEVNREAQIFLSEFWGARSASLTFLDACGSVGRLKSWTPAPLLAPAFLGATPAAGDVSAVAGFDGESPELDLRGVNVVSVFG